MKETTESLAAQTFINKEERDALLKLLENKKTDRNVEIAVKKLLGMHDLFTNEILYSPIKTLREYLSSVLGAMSKAKDYLEKDEIVSVQVELANEYNTGRQEEMTHTISVMRDKFNGVPERLNSFQKNIYDTSEDLIKLTAIHIKHGSPDMVKELEDDVNKVGSFTDRNARRF